MFKELEIMKTNILTNNCKAFNKYLGSIYSLLDSVSSPCRCRVLAILLLCLTLGIGQMWGAVGGTLKTYDTNSSTFSTGYASQAGDNFVWYGQKNYFGANNAACSESTKC